MREIKVGPNWHLPETRRTEFTKDEMIDIIDFYLQYKPMLDENAPNHHLFSPHYFTKLLFMYDMVDVDYIDNMEIIRKNYGKRYVEDLSKEKLSFLEIITVFTFISRAERHAGGGWYEDCIADGTYYNLLCRLDEIKNDLESE